MISPIHIGFNLILLTIISNLIGIQITPIIIILILCAELVDLDHLRAKPIYHPRRNPFKTHFLHKQWKLILLISIILLPIYPLTFLGLGLISHLFVDLIYIKINKL